MKFRWNKHFATAAFGIAGVFSLLAPAQAVIVTTNYDPPFAGAPLAGYGWRATINYEVPSDCFNQTGTKWNISLFGIVLGCGSQPLVDQIKVLSAQAGIYDTTDPNFLLDVLTFDPASLPLSIVHVTLPTSLDYVVSYSLADGNNYSNFVRGHETFDDDIRFRLYLNGPSALLQFNCDVDVAGCNGWQTAPAPLETEYINQGNRTFADVFAETELKVGNNVPGVVPEPASLALVLLALGAGVAASRRRPTRPSAR